MIEINYIVGDATNPIGEGDKVIVHCCNNRNVWGAGFVRALSNKWEQPELSYCKWFGSIKNTLPLGEVQFVSVERDIIVANLIGQEMGYVNGQPPIRYEAIRQGLTKVREYCIQHNCSFHSPRFGAALSGGSWEIIEEIIKREICSYDIPVTVYDFVDTKSPFYVPSNK